ncbi:type II toxin-antitoxin system VapC family toxin [Pedobacter sp. MC2016-14]|uniref:type II toxin-antitoxin system VapC family toxin n=1 Tax=Pedobacter sp. MC2016-14 TaxID=2897327 RepID=UPI00351D37FF
MQQYLLDTHTLLWMQDDNDALSLYAKQVLNDTNNDLYVSIATFWEITIKQSIGKLQLDYTIDELIKSCVINNIFILPIQIEYLKVLKDLPLIHRDPFDRIIVATAIDMNYKLISRDSNVSKYAIDVIW